MAERPRAQRRASRGRRQAPRYAPYYWGIKESAYERWRGDAELLAQVQRLTKLLYFMHPEESTGTGMGGGWGEDEGEGTAQDEWEAQETLRDMRQSPEFWLGANGTGAKAHVDGHCQSTLSMQLSGVRRWRLGAPPPGLRRSLGQQLNDGDPYTHYSNNGSQWQPTFAGTVHAGEALVFAPGFTHETLNVSGGCSVGDAPVRPPCRGAPAAGSRACAGSGT